MMNLKKGVVTAGIALLAGILCLSVPSWAQANCVDSSGLLGDAGLCAVFQLGGAKVSAAHGDPTGVDGDLCLGAGGELSMSGGQVITGTAYLDPLVDKVPNDLAQRAGAVVELDLSDRVATVAQSVSALDALACHAVFDKLKIDESELWFASAFNPGGGETVVCVNGDMEVKGSDTTLVLAGNPGDSFVFKIGGAFKVNQAEIQTLGPLTPSDVVYYLEGSGKDVAFSGGGGGIGCCNAEADGTILAPERKVALSPGRVNGQVVSSKNISLSSGSLVSCVPGMGGGCPDIDCPCTVNEDCTSMLCHPVTNTCRPGG